MKHLKLFENYGYDDPYHIVIDSLQDIFDKYQIEEDAEGDLSNTKKYCWFYHEGKLEKGAIVIYIKNLVATMDQKLFFRQIKYEIEEKRAIIEKRTGYKLDICSTNHGKQIEVCLLDY